MIDKQTKAALVKLFDQIKAKNKDQPIELTLVVDGESLTIVNSIEPVPTVNTKETR